MPPRAPTSPPLHPVFQPIVRLHDGAVMAYEILLRGPAGSGMSAAAFFAEARRQGRASALERESLREGARSFAGQALPGRLFANFSETALLEGDPGDLVQAMLAAGLSPGRLVLELRQDNPGAPRPELLRVAEELRRTGVAIALDDFGEGQSNLRLWSDIQPEFVKVGRHFVHGIDRDPQRFRIVRSLVQLAEGFSTHLVAHGIEQPGELAVLRDLAVPYGQGHLLGMPQTQASAAAPPRAMEVLQSGKIAVYPESVRRPQRQDTVGQLVSAAPSVPPTHTNDALMGLLRDQPRLHAIAVVEHGAPVGLINRRAFIDRFSQPYHRELFGRRSCTLFMNAAPLVVDKGTPLEALVRILSSSDQRYLSEGFIVTDQGRYLGLGTGEALVAAVTELRVEAARHANPLTFLPGNIPLTEHIERLIAASSPFVACYLDLNHFKPYNDQYGYWRGDEVIKLVARTVADHCDPLRDFVGHVGGDDFVVLFQSDDWEQRCGALISAFNAAVRVLFDEEDLARGGIHGEDRRGNPSFFPLTTLSAGAVVCAGGRDYLSAEELASAAAGAKRQAKHSGRSLVVLAQPPSTSGAAQPQAD